MNEEQRRPRIVESPSATTDPDNARSGKAAYVIAAAAVVLSALIGMGLRGCVRMAGDIAGNWYGGYGSVYDYDDGLDSDDLDYDDLDDLFGEDGTGEDWWLDDIVSDEGDASSETHGGRSSVEDLLGEDLAMYSYTIDACLSASDYANAQKDVSGFARTVVVTDKEASATLAESLRAAAWGSGSVSKALEDGVELATSTARDIRALELPGAAGDKADDVLESLKEARADAAERWDAIAAELTLFQSARKVSTRDLADLEDDVTDATDDAAEELSEALRDSRG